MKTIALLLCAGSVAAAAAVAQTSSTSSAPPPPPFGPSVTAGQTLQTSDMTNANPLIPADIYRTSAVAHQDLATFAWLEFISAVAPNAAGSRGVPGGSFATSGSGGTGPLVWETYQHRTELFPCNVNGTSSAPTPPQPWGASPKYVTTVTNSNPQLCSTITLPGGGTLPYNNLDEANQIGQNTLFFPTTPGNPQPATDAQVLFEAKVNQYESNYVNQNYASFTPLYSPFRLPAGTVNLPTTTVEVKAAWRPLSSIPSSQRYRYHVSNVLTYGGSDSAPVPRVVPYALIALHIIHKTPNYPAFIFATFEQVDDFKNQVTGQPTGVYYVPAYGSVGYTTPTSTTFPPSGKTAPNPNINFSTSAPKAVPYGTKGVALPLGNVSSIAGAKVLKNGAVAIPVTSPVPAVPEITAVNNRALTAMKGIPGFNQNFIWQYYKLTGVQAIPTNDETTRDFYLANIVVESSQPGIQLFRGFPPITNGVLTNIRNQVNVIDYHNGLGTLTSSGGCQGCHGIAQTQNGFDFSFLFFGVAGGGFSPETAGLPSPQLAAARLANKKYFTK
ncbi:MAG: hypothetical protein P0Y59_03645 [Candidatus Sphingomonas phytovorans]|nr:hypothetical protein [Sphingomonas sp.]WEK00803.1 MAG: hypothetical protein P0Y59_03645 [Sphingomonas sp.]